MHALPHNEGAAARGRCARLSGMKRWITIVHCVKTVDAALGARPGHQGCCSCENNVEGRNNGALILGHVRYDAQQL